MKALVWSLVLLTVVIVSGCSKGSDLSINPTMDRVVTSSGPYTRTLVIGADQTKGWFTDFEGKVINDEWELLWAPGAGIENWVDSGFAGWSNPFESSCPVTPELPERVVLTIDGDPRAQAQWATDIEAAVMTIQIKFPGVSEIVLQPAVGGVADGECSIGADPVRSTVNHPLIDMAIDTLVGGMVVKGFSPEVFNCSYFTDIAGNMTTAGKVYVGTRIANYFKDLLLTHGLIAHWKFNEGGGITLVDSSSMGHNGVIYNDPTPVETRNGGGYHFDAHDDYMAVPDNVSLPPADISNIVYGTVSAWFKYDDVTNDGVVAECLPIFYLGESDPTKTLAQDISCVMMYIGHAGLADPTKRPVLFTVVLEHKVALCWDSIFSLVPGEWYNFVITVGPDGHHSYMNGQEIPRHYRGQGISESSYGFFCTNNENDILDIGYGAFGVSGKWYDFNGTIDDLRIYNYALTAQEISDLYGDTLALISPPDGYTTQTWSPVSFQWDGTPGYDGLYYLEVMFDGAPFSLFTHIPVSSKSIGASATLVDKFGPYGDYSWRVIKYESYFGTVNSSDWNTLHRTPPEILTPADCEVVTADTVFTWNLAPSSSPDTTWYVCRVDGASLGGGFRYMWWLNAGQAAIPGNWYPYLQNLGGGEFHWTVVAACGDPSTPGGLDMTLDYATKLQYPATHTFFVE